MSAVHRFVEAYGPADLQVGEWLLPQTAGRLPTVLLVHGGFWRATYDRHLEDAIADDLAGHGYLVWNIDYRPSTFPWPTTLHDVAAAHDHLAHGKHADQVDLNRVAVVGHSAGGHLALWLAGRHQLPFGSTGGRPAVPPPTLAVSQSGVAALTAAADHGLGDGAALALVGGPPADLPDRYWLADPSRRLPTGVRSVLIHATGDDVVPALQSELYLAAAQEAGDDCTLDPVPGDHYVHLLPGTAAIDRLHAALAATLG